MGNLAENFRPSGVEKSGGTGAVPEDSRLEGRNSRHSSLKEEQGSIQPGRKFPDRAMGQ